MDPSRPHDQGERGDDQVLDLNFVPAWARKPPGLAADVSRDAVAYPSSKRDKARGPRRTGPARGERPEGRTRSPRRERSDTAPRARHPRDDRPARVGERDRTESAAPRRRHQDAAATERPGPARSGEPPRTYRRREALCIQARPVPDQKALRAVAHRVHSTRMAYPVMDLASIFTRRPQLTRMRLEATGEGDATQVFFQCHLCGYVSRQEPSALAHIADTHLADFFDVEETETEAPSGQFVCVGRCGLSGALLGPPNHHTYTERVNAIHRTRYPSMPIDAYRARIELVKDEALIEQWRQESRRVTVYRRKGQEPQDATESGPGLTRQQAEDLMLHTVAPEQVSKTRKAMVPVPVGLKLDDAALQAIVMEQWQQECRFPLRISFALRAAFKHMHLHVFRAGDNAHFVATVAPTPLDPDHAVEAIREIIGCLHANPGMTRGELIKTLRPDADADSEAAHEILQPLRWLTERGHIIEFFNGALSIPLGRRKAEAPRRSPRKEEENT